MISIVNRSYIVISKSIVHLVPNHHATVAIGANVHWMATVGKKLWFMKLQWRRKILESGNT